MRRMASRRGKIASMRIECELTSYLLDAHIVQPILRIQISSPLHSPE